ALLEKGQGIAQKNCRQDQDQERPESPADDQGGAPATRPLAPAVLDVFTLPSTFPFHRCSPRSCGLQIMDRARSMPIVPGRGVQGTSRNEYSAGPNPGQQGAVVRPPPPCGRRRSGAARSMGRWGDGKVSDAEIDRQLFLRLPAREDDFLDGPQPGCGRQG